MLLRGLIDLESLRSESGPLHSGLLRKASISLYPLVINEPDADCLAERILFHFADDRGVFKRTYTARFDAFDEEVGTFLEKHFSTKDPLAIQDVGTSDGRTACDFFVRLRSRFPNIAYFASDYGVLVKVIGNEQCRLVLSSTNKLLELEFRSYVFHLSKRLEFRSYFFYPLNIFICWYALHFPAKRLLMDYRLGNLPPPQEILLFCPKALRLASEDKRFSLEEQNVLHPLGRSSHVIRAMNLLNSSYFTKEEFLCILRHMHTALFDDGFLITGSNGDAGTPVHGGIYRKSSSGFEEMHRFGNGSPIAEIIALFEP